MTLADRVLDALKSQEPWREDHLHLYSPDQVRRVIEELERLLRGYDDRSRRRRTVAGQ